MRRIELLQDGNVVKLYMRQKRNDKLEVRIEGSNMDADKECTKEIVSKIRWMLQMDEDLSEFYKICEENAKLVVGKGKGRILRSPTIFEEIIKTICTTNITWKQTRNMISRLVRDLGTPYPRDFNLCTFPTPEQIAAVDSDFLRENVKTGYRSPYISKFAKDWISMLLIQWRHRKYSNW